MIERADQTASSRIEALLAEVEAAPSVARASEKTEELVRALVAFYGEGLERLLTIVHDAAGDRSPTVFEALCNDRFVESLLALHDLHPLSLEERVRAALDSVRPYLESHEGGVEIERVADGVAYLRLEGSCEGCPSSAATIKLAVERAIFERVPEIVEVRATGVAPAATTGSLRIESDWIALDRVPALAREGHARVTLSDLPVLLVSVDETMYAYRDRCPACGDAFGATPLEGPFIRCASCGRRYDVVRAGRAEDDAGIFAEPLPLVRDGERVRVAIPIGV